jgi:hypothetical protein
MSASGAVGRARTFLRTSMQSYGWLPASGRRTELAADDVLLVAVELVTNACLHGGGPVELRMIVGDGTVRIEVDDRNDRLPEPRSPFEGPRAGGHGLHIVRRLARDWGVEVHTGFRARGKTVWAELVAPDRAEAEQAAADEGPAG